jgi:uncharacterized protein
MRVERLSPPEFHEKATPFLLEHEVEHCVMLGLSSRLAGDPLAYGAEAYLALAIGEERIAAAAVRTPPHALLVSVTEDPAALQALAADVHDRFRELPGVITTVPVGEQFVGIWSALTGARSRVSVAERVYRTSSVSHPGGVPGGPRPYGDDDWELTLRWIDAFRDEALPEPSALDNSEALRRKLADPDSGFLFWEDGAVVSMAGYTGRTPNGIRIGPVYTPPELRGRGYGTAVTAALTERLLAEGRAFCFLFTDLANPTSNAIYQRIGYEPVADVNWWLFE